MAVDIQGAGQLRILFQPVFGEQAGPDFRSPVVLPSAELLELVSQTADFRHAVQPHQLAEFTWRLVLKLLDRANATQSHVSQQQDHVQRRVVAGQRGKGRLQMTKQAVLGQRRQRTQHAAIGNIAARFKLCLRSAGQLSQGGQDALDRPCASDPHLFARGSVFVAACRFIAGRFTASLCGGSRRSRSRRCPGVCFALAAGGGRRRTVRPWEASLINRFAERVVGHGQLPSHLGFGMSFFQELPGPLDDFGGHHRSPAGSPRLVEALDALLRIRLDAPHHAALGDAKGSDDVGLFDGSLDAELSGEHAKGLLIPLGMLEDGLRSAEIDPLSVLPHDADQIVDAGSIFGNQRQ
jgi:hypothetical protein